MIRTLFCALVECFKATFAAIQHSTIRTVDAFDLYAENDAILRRLRDE